MGAEGSVAMVLGVAMVSSTAAAMVLGSAPPLRRNREAAKASRGKVAAAALLLWAGLVCGCGGEDEGFSGLRGPYLGQQPPGLRPQLFAPGIVSTGLHEYHAMFSPSGDEFYFQLGREPHVIMVMKMSGGRWSAPETVSFSGIYNDCEPCISPDGSRLVFMSERPPGKAAGGIDRQGGYAAGVTDSAMGVPMEMIDPVTGERTTIEMVPPGDKDIWVTRRIDGGWTEPSNIGAPVNTEDNEFFPVFSPEGDLYFSADYEGNSDIYMARRDGEGFSVPERLGAEINTGHDDYDVAIAPDGSYMIFGSARRQDGQGQSDLYISFRTGWGGWTRAVNMGPEINSPRAEVAPTISPDGKYIFFSSNRILQMGYYPWRMGYEDVKRISSAPGNGSGDIYWVSARVVEEFRP